MARLVALVQNWWGIFTRERAGSIKVITTRPALIEGVAQRTEHAREVKLKMTSMQGKAKKIDNLLSGMSEHPHRFLVGATQLDEKTRWSTLLRRIFWHFYGGSPPIKSPATPLPAG